MFSSLLFGAASEHEHFYSRDVLNGSRTVPKRADSWAFVFLLRRRERDPNKKCATSEGGVCFVVVSQNFKNEQTTDDALFGRERDIFTKFFDIHLESKKCKIK